MSQTHSNIDLSSIHEKLDDLNETLTNLRLLVVKLESGLSVSDRLHHDILDRVAGLDKEIYGNGNGRGLKSDLRDVKLEVESLSKTKGLVLKLLVYPVVSVMSVGAVLYLLSMFFASGKVSSIPPLTP